VLVILLRSAVKASPEGGWVTLGSWGDGDIARITVTDAALEPPWRASGQDAVSEMDLEAWWGLPHCRHLLEAMGGEIEVGEMAGRGTTIILELPRATSVSRRTDTGVLIRTAT